MCLSVFNKSNLNLKKIKNIFAEALITRRMKPWETKKINEITNTIYM
jgi:hypothetical protein